MDNLSGKRGQHRIKSLLLLVNLFVARTLCNCPKPVLPENIVLTNEALLMNEFPNNVKIALTCANGYVKDSGSGKMECTDGAWGHLDLTCKKKDCGKPPSQPNTTFILNQGTLFGAVALVICDKGFYVKGSSYKHCYGSGWTAKSTKCLILTCEMPAKILNGWNSWVSNDYPKYGESVTYTCNEGHKLSGNATIMCSDDGEYDLKAPECRGVTKEDAFTTRLVTTSTSTTTRPTQGGNTLTSEGTTTTTLSPTTCFTKGNRNDEIDDTKKDVGYMPVIISVVCVSIAACVLVLFIHKLLKKKGSYDTREDLKPELLPFQNL